MASYCYLQRGNSFLRQRLISFGSAFAELHVPVGMCVVDLCAGRCHTAVHRIVASYTAEASMIH